MCNRQKRNGLSISKKKVRVCVFSYIFEDLTKHQYNVENEIKKWWSRHDEVFKNWVEDPTANVKCDGNFSFSLIRNQGRN